MKEYIEREALNKVIDYEIEVCNSGIAKGALEFLKVRVEPAADVVEVRHGQMIEGECTVCGWHGDCVDTPYYNYCPNCGCKMDREE